MNKKALTFLFAGLLIGLIVGLGAGSRYPETTSEGAKPLLSGIKDNAIKSSISREQELLMEAIQELDLTTSELKEARTKLQAQKESVRRYNYLMDLWSKKGLEGCYFGMWIGNNSITPCKEIAQLFGWDHEMVKTIGSTGRTALDKIKEWEAQNAVYIETAEDALIYELPAAPDTFKTEYLGAMAEIIPEEEFALLQDQLEEYFRRRSNPRTFTLTIGPPPPEIVVGPEDAVNQEWMIVKVQEKSKHKDSAPAHSFMTPYVEGRTVPADWNHIFRLATDPTAGEIDDSGTTE